MIQEDNMFKYKGFHPKQSEVAAELMYRFIDKYNKKPAPTDTIRTGCGYFEYTELGWKVIDEGLQVARIPGSLL